MAIRLSITPASTPQNERSLVMSNKHKYPTINFRISDVERKQIEARILASGMMKRDYFVRSCIYNLNFQFDMYEPATDSIIVNTGENSILVIRCKECNSSVIFDDPNDIVYLYRLAEETLLTYTKLALKNNGLQDYVDAMNEIN